MQVIKLESEKAAILLPIDAVCGDVGKMLEGVYFAEYPDGMLSNPIALKEHENNFIVLDGTKRSLVSILSGKSVKGFVYKNAEDPNRNHDAIAARNFNEAEDYLT